ncbi:protease complex subunit PrcB family protein [Panacagrimonas sp.]|uniref:protease complex subunit PrcB family protein n=1 Tax=Panacagrimonas sp. TaxID=2480088 RepID=UPI003B51E1C2
MRFLIPIIAASLLGACAKPAWVRLPDTSDWFSKAENLVQVEEVARANVCHSVTDEIELAVLGNVAAMQALASGRGFEWVRNSAKSLPETAYAVVEFGQRPNSGYGLAVSREAALQGDTLRLRATFFEPQQGRWAGSEPSSPCVAVSIPGGAYERIELVDQTGRVRAMTRLGGA